jgi:hypothetical protein
MAHKQPLKLNARQRRSLKRAQARMQWALENRKPAPEPGWEAGEKPIHRPIQAGRNTVGSKPLSGTRCS